METNSLKEALASTLNWIAADLRTCCYCGSLWGLTPFLCSRCGRQLYEHRSVRKVSFGSFETYSALTWLQNSGLIKAVVYGQKGGLNSHASGQLAQLILDARLEAGPLPKKPLLVPAPSSGGGHRDHASALAYSLSKLTGWPVRESLYFQGFEGGQKARNRDKRRDLKIFSLENLSNSSDNIVVIDDVITTGSTMNSCFKALGRPQRFEGWSLAYRELSFGLNKTQSS